MLYLYFRVQTQPCAGAQLEKPQGGPGIIYLFAYRTTPRVTTSLSRLLISVGPAKNFTSHDFCLQYSFTFFYLKLGSKWPNLFSQFLSVIISHIKCYFFIFSTLIRGCNFVEHKCYLSCTVQCTF